MITALPTDEELEKFNDISDKIFQSISYKIDNFIKTFITLNIFLWIKNKTKRVCKYQKGCGLSSILGFLNQFSRLNCQAK